MTHNSQLQIKGHSQDFKPLHLKVHSDGGFVAFLISVPAKPLSKKEFKCYSPHISEILPAYNVGKISHRLALFNLKTEISPAHFFYISMNRTVLKNILHCLPADQTCFPHRDVTHNYDLGYGKSMNTMISFF